MIHVEISGLGWLIPIFALTAAYLAGFYEAKYKALKIVRRHVCTASPTETLSR